MNESSKVSVQDAKQKETYDTYVKQQLQRREYELDIARLKEERDNLRAHFMELNKNKESL